MRRNKFVRNALRRSNLFIYFWQSSINLRIFADLKDLPVPLPDAATASATSATPAGGATSGTNSSVGKVAIGNRKEMTSNPNVIVIWIKVNK